MHHVDRICWYDTLVIYFINPNLLNEDRVHDVIRVLYLRASHIRVLYLRASHIVIGMFYDIVFGNAKVLFYYLIFVEPFWYGYVCITLALIEL